MTTPNHANSKADRSASVAPLPSEMPKKNPSPVSLALVGGLVETKAISWDRKTIKYDENGKEVILSTRTSFEGLRYPLAQNVSELNVERASRAV